MVNKGNDTERQAGATLQSLQGLAKELGFCSDGSGVLLKDAKQENDVTCVEKNLLDAV